jgi:glycosidase
MKRGRILSVFFLLFAFCACRPDPFPDSQVPSDDGYQQCGIPFQSVPDNDDIILYEVNLRAFSSQGNLQGVIDKLDHLESLHVNVLWLMPLHPIGAINSVNSPYSVKDYMAVSNEYGDLQKLRELTDAAHAHGMAVIMDWVANHTAWDHPWITNPTWYTQDANGAIVMPPGTNWADVADLNFNNSDMRASMIDAMKFWILEANVDGYRCDYADGVPFDFWLQAISELRAIPDRKLIMLAEGARIDHYDAGFDMTFAWEYYTGLKNVFAGQPAYTLNALSNNEFIGLPSGKQKLRFTTNHDQSAWEASPPSLFGGTEGATAATVAMTFMQGVPLIYTGQETGRATTTPFFSNSPIDWNANADMVNAYREVYGIYAESDAARKGSSTLYSANDALIVERVFNGEHVLVIVNVRNTAVSVPMPSALVNTVWTEAITGSNEFIGSTMAMMPYQYKILRYEE